MCWRNKGKFTQRHAGGIEPAQGDPMSADSIAPSATLKRQLPSFVAIGFFGYVVDATVTYGLARGYGVDPLLARFPAFAIATVANFLLNRYLTFAHTTTDFLAAFARYVMVCAVGLAVNYATYATALTTARIVGFPTTPGYLPLFVAFGSGAAMFVTYFGFRRFAFRV
jgi:putative flippase GtrA